VTKRPFHHDFCPHFGFLLSSWTFVLKNDKRFIVILIYGAILNYFKKLSFKIWLKILISVYLRAKSNFHSLFISPPSWIFIWKSQLKFRVRKFTPKKPCRQIYDSQNILRTFSKNDRIQNIIHINV
jgi:hypothetical protein